MYVPNPIDTTDIELTPDVHDLIERLAAHNHDIWARQRIAEGWTRGPRDDVAKTNPDLVPYEELSETEKSYDRNTAIEVLKAIVALGYNIAKGSGS